MKYLGKGDSPESIVTKQRLEETISERIAAIPKAGVDTPGLLSSEDYSKLAGIEPSANFYTHPTAHPISFITGLQAALDAKAPSVHSHTIANIENLQNTLNAKAPTSHTHEIANITNLQTTLNGKANASHTHSVGNVTGLQAALDDKADVSYVDTIAAELDDKANASHAHLMSGVEGLEAALSSKASASHVYAIAAELNEKANAAHSHDIDNVTGLQAALDGKVDDSQVLTNVPLNAKFTDTITTINSKTGAITKADIVALGIPAQDTVVDISGKADKTYVDNKVKTDVPVGAKFTDTVYTHPESHPASMITNLPTGKKVGRFVVGTSTAGWTTADCDYLCDGIDDQAEINAAIIALPATGGEVVILDGAYNITAKIDVTKDNVSIRGNGNATILKRMYNSITDEGVITLTNRSGCKIANLQVDGNYNDGFGIFLESSSYNVVTGNTCNNNNSTNSGFGIFLLDSSNNTATNNICNNNGNSLFLYNSNHNVITGNTCNSNSNNGIYLLELSDNNIITSNTCNNNNNSGINLFDSRNNIVTDNICNSNANNGLNLESSSYNTVTDNTCNNNTNSGSGIFILGSGGNTVTGNTLYNNSYSGIFLESSGDTTVTGNTCSNNANSGLTLISSNRNTVTGNTCINGNGLTTDYTESQSTIRLYGASNSYNLISNNNCMGKAPVVEGGTGNSVYGNKYDSGDYKDFTQDEKTKLAGIAASANNYTHPTTPGNKHIPTGGASGQVLKYSASGTAIWGADNDTITTINGKTGAISKADIVALGIPSQDTNTTYSEITTAEIDTGTASTLRTITARRLKYLLDKIVALFPTKTSELTNDSGFLTSVTKSDVGLSNVTNDKQMPISGGVLENYREKLTTVSASGGSINLSLGNVFVHTPSGNRTYSITNAVNGQAHSFTLIINQTATVRTLTFPASVKWQNGDIPDLSTASKTYVLTFMTVNGGTTWLGMFGGEF